MGNRDDFTSCCIVRLVFYSSFRPRGGVVQVALWDSLFIDSAKVLVLFLCQPQCPCILTKESISMIGPVRDFEDGFLADIKASLRQLFLVNRHVEMKWSEIEKVERPGYRGLGLYFYTKAGQRYFLNTSLLDIKFMPTFKRYMKYKNVVKW